MVPEQLAPTTVAERSDALARSDDVGEKYRREGALRLFLVPGAGIPNVSQEALDLSGRPFEVTGGQFEKACARDLPRHPVRAVDRQGVVDPMSKQRRHPDCGQHVTDVDVLVHQVECLDGSRTSSLAEVTSQQPALAFIATEPVDRVLLGLFPRSEEALVRLHPPSELLVCGTPRPIGGPETSREAADQHECGRACRAGRRNRMLIGAPSEMPTIAARADPTASITARTSSILVSSVGAPGTRSDMPVPRLSKTIRRALETRRGRRTSNGGVDHPSSTCDTNPRG
jgi:hypothetical protein